MISEVLLRRSPGVSGKLRLVSVLRFSAPPHFPRRSVV